MKHRLFFAVDFREEVKAELYDHAVRFAEPIGLKVTPPEKLHITVRFLGDTDEAVIPSIIDNTRFLSEFTGMPCTFTKLGFFYRNRLPSVFYIHCEVSPEFMELTRKLELEVNALGFPGEGKRFIPHLTYSRLKRDPGKYFMTEVLSAAPLNIETEVEKAVLFKSELQRTGAVYTVLKQY